MEIKSEKEEVKEIKSPVKEVKEIVKVEEQPVIKYDYSPSEEQWLIKEIQTIFKGTKETLSEAFELEDLDSKSFVTPEGLWNVFLAIENVP